MRIVQYGCGKMSKFTMKFAVDAGYEIVGAIDIDESVIGQDIGDIMEIDKTGVIVRGISDADALFKEVEADVCILTTMSLLSDCEEALRICASNGVNCITTCEEAFYPHNSNPTLTDELDKIAKVNNCTLTGSGYQDAFWGNLISTMAGSSSNINKIKGYSSYNVEDYGIALAQAHGAGLSKSEFDEQIASADAISADERMKLIESGDFLPSYMWNVNGWLCDKLGLTVEMQEQKCIPTFNDVAISSSTLNMNLESGICTGMNAVVTTKTKEGIEIESECVGKVYSNADVDTNNWIVVGESSTNMLIKEPDTVRLTCSAVVNRLEDLVAADAGFVPTSKMGELKYKNRK